MPELLAVCVGRPRLVQTGKRVVKTAIWKAPVEGRVRAAGVNLEGDDQADREVHGGPDKAIYAYASEDTAFWEDVLGRELGPGAFGENLWTRGLDLTNALVGERWRIGTATLEVAQPRMPCFKLGIRMEDPAFLKRFTLAERPGAYLRIAGEGDLGAGDAIEVLHRPSRGVSMREFAAAVQLDHSKLPRLLELGDQLPALLRPWVEDRVRRTA